MDYTNVEVALTISDRGAQATRGSYEFKQTGHGFEKVGNVMEKYPVGTLVTTKLPKMHNCFRSTTLNSSFVNWAISDDARPKRQVSARYWKNLSKKNRLVYHINKYVDDLYGKMDFSFEVID